MWHKRCTGPAHDEHEYLPATEKYFYFRKSGKNKGRPQARCRLCSNWTKLKSPGSHHGYIPVDAARPYYTEIVNRIGVTELHRRSGLATGHILRVLTDMNKKYVEKAKLRKVMLELVSARRKNEYSISKGARWRQERRNAKHIELCAGCGTPKNNATIGCTACRTRHYDRFSKGQITKKEWNKIQAKIRTERIDDGFIRS